MPQDSFERLAETAALPPTPGMAVYKIPGCLWPAGSWGRLPPSGQCRQCHGATDKILVWETPLLDPGLTLTA